MATYSRKKAFDIHHALGQQLSRVYKAVFPSSTKAIAEDTDKVVIEDSNGDRHYINLSEIGTGGGSGGATPMYIYIKATSQSEGDLHLSDAVNWNTSLALIKNIKIVTNSTDWDLYILQNDNGYLVNDANIPSQVLNEGGNTTETIMLDYSYEDEDATDEVHLYWIDNSGSNTADIYITGYELSEN